MDIEMKEVFELELKSALSQKQISTTNLIIQRFEQMDVEGLEQLLDEDVVGDKYLKLADVKIIFEKFKGKGDTKLIHEKGKCTDCFPGSITHHFKGNKSGYHTSFIIRENNGVVCKLFMCYFHYQKVGDKLIPESSGFISRGLG